LRLRLSLKKTLRVEGSFSLVKGRFLGSFYFKAGERACQEFWLD
jgi:hypothetical protein